LLNRFEHVAAGLVSSHVQLFTLNIELLST